jgi:hypothetical protein
MSSDAQRDLKVLSCNAYLTDRNVEKRQVDWTAMWRVKALKGDPINGFFEVSTSTGVRRFDQYNVAEFLKMIPGRMAKAILANITGPATLVPIPNSHIVDPTTAGFKTLDLARGIAARSEGRLTAVPALVFREPQAKSRGGGGSRRPAHFEAAYRLVEDVSGSIVLIDDVKTTGGHIVGACWKLESPKRSVVLACTYGSTVHEQVPDPLADRIENLPLDRADEFTF